MRARALPKIHQSIPKILLGNIQGDPQVSVSSVWAPHRREKDARIGLSIREDTVTTTAVVIDYDLLF
jgi:hypothetical protein